MSLKTVLHRPAEDDYTELTEEQEQAGHVGIVVDRLEAFTDADRVIRCLREGKLVFARIGQFKHTNLDELRRTISKIKMVCNAVDGEIVSVSNNDWLIVAPPSTKVVK